MSIFKSTILFSVFTLLAQVLGVLRDVLLVRFAGVGSQLDTYYMAFKIPDLLNGFYAIFLGSVIFIPIITKAYKNKSKEEVVVKINEVASFVFVLIIAFSTIIFIAMPLLVNYLVPSWDALQKTELIKLSRILIFSQLFFPLGIIAGSIGMVFGNIKSVAISGLIYNIGILFGVLALYPIFGIVGVCYGVVLGAILFAAVQIFPKEVRQIFFKIRFVYTPQIWKSFVINNYPRLISVFGWQAFILALAVFAATFGTSAVSVFTLAYNMEVSVISILGMSLASVLMPIFSKHHEAGDDVAMQKDLTQSVTIVSWFGLLFTFLFYFLSYETVKVLFYFSNLTLDKELAIAFVFAIFILSLAMQNYFEIIRKYFYATNKIWEVSIMIIVFIAFATFFYFISKNYLNLSTPVSSIAFAFFFANIITCTFITIYYKIYKIINFNQVFNNLKNIIISIFLSIFVFSIAILFFPNIFILAKDMHILSFASVLLYSFVKFLALLLLVLCFCFVLKDKILFKYLSYFKNKVL